jgi:hypothetical protein
VVVGEGEFVVGWVYGRSLAGAVVAERGGGVVDGQALQACLQVIRAYMGFARARLIGTALLVGYVLRPRHGTVSRTFGGRAIVTGYPVTWLRRKGGE